MLSMTVCAFSLSLPVAFFLQIEHHVVVGRMRDHHAELAGKKERLVICLLVGQRRNRHRLVADIHVVRRLQGRLALRAVQLNLTL
jgi:hypothetical protein